VNMLSLPNVKTKFHSRENGTILLFKLGWISRNL